jgi:hypothetical protein
VTSYCEDSPGVGTFQYRLVGFRDPPTDYYPRAFFLAAEESFSDKNPHCYGSEKIHNYPLNLAKEIFQQYPERKKFIFHFPGIKKLFREFRFNVQYMNIFLSSVYGTPMNEF